MRTAQIKFALGFGKAVRRSFKWNRSILIDRYDMGRQTSGLRASAGALVLLALLFWPGFSLVRAQLPTNPDFETTWGSWQKGRGKSGGSSEPQVRPEDMVIVYTYTSSSTQVFYTATLSYTVQAGEKTRQSSDGSQTDTAPFPDTQAGERVEAESINWGVTNISSSPTSGTGAVAHFTTPVGVGRLTFTISNLIETTPGSSTPPWRGTQSFTKSIDLVPGTPVLLLLHGMNSNTATWDAFVNDSRTFGGSATDIRDRVIQGPAPTPNAQGVLCYRLRFGAYDSVSTRRGVEGITVTSATGILNGTTYPYLHDNIRCGDFETFDELGQEVGDAIDALLERHPNARIILLGHSRGGLAARAFLQASGYATEKAAVVGLVTTGSPHLGGRLGRVYNWLDTHRRGAAGTDSDDWDVVDQLRNHDPSLDVRRPVIGDVADISPAIAGLNGAGVVGNLPAAIRYGEIGYMRADLGFIARAYGFEIRVFDIPGPNLGEQLSDNAATFILGVGKTPSDYPGDGLIHGPGQVFTQLSGFHGIAVQRLINTADVVLHTEEPSRVDDLRVELKRVNPGWFP